MEESYTELERRRILAIIGNQKELINLAYIELYTANKHGDSWLYSDIEGFLCFILDYKQKTKSFLIFDTNTYQVLFKFEFYNNFSKFYEQLSPSFYSFEINEGFIGFKFDNTNEAHLFNIAINKFNDDFCKNILFKNSENFLIKPNKGKIASQYAMMLKEKFYLKGNIDESFIEDGLQISKPFYFELLNNISFDRDKKIFKIGKIPKEFQKLFKDTGIKKSDLKNPNLAVNIVKSVIESIDDMENGRSERAGLQMKKTIEKLEEEKKKVNFEKNENEDEKGKGYVDANDYYYKEQARRLSKDNLVIGLGKIDEEEDADDELAADDFRKGTISKMDERDEKDLGMKKNDKANTVDEVEKIKNEILSKENNIKTNETIPKVPESKIPNVPININNNNSNIKIPSVPKIIPTAPLLNNKTQTTSSQINKFNTKEPQNHLFNTKADTKPIALIKSDPEPKISSVSDSTTATSSSSVSHLLSEIRTGIKLKKIEPNTSSTSADNRPKINKRDTDLLQTTLAEAIRLRRFQITKNDKDDSNSDTDSDWSV